MSTLSLVDCSLEPLRGGWSHLNSRDWCSLHDVVGYGSTLRQVRAARGCVSVYVCVSASLHISWCRWMNELESMALYKADGPYKAASLYSAVTSVPLSREMNAAMPWVWMVGLSTSSKQKYIYFFSSSFLAACFLNRWSSTGSPCRTK